MNQSQGPETTSQTSTLPLSDVEDEDLAETTPPVVNNTLIGFELARSAGIYMHRIPDLEEQSQSQNSSSPSLGIN